MESQFPGCHLILCSPGHSVGRVVPPPRHWKTTTKCPHPSLALPPKGCLGTCYPLSSVSQAWIRVGPVLVPPWVLVGPTEGWLCGPKDEQPLQWHVSCNPVVLRNGMSHLQRVLAWDWCGCHEGCDLVVMPWKHAGVSHWPVRRGLAAIEDIYLSRRPAPAVGSCRGGGSFATTMSSSMMAYHGWCQCQGVAPRACLQERMETQVNQGVI